MPAEAPDGLKMAVFTPISRPALSSKGPPELPGLIAAFVWMTPLIWHWFSVDDLAIQGADHPGGQGLIQSEWIADGEGFLADLEVVRGPDQDRMELALGCVDFQHGQVLVRRCSHDSWPYTCLVAEDYLER